MRNVGVMLVLAVIVLAVIVAILLISASLGPARPTP